MVMADRRQRLAWIILLSGFVTFVALLVLVPLTANVVLQRAMRPLTVRVQANEGTVGIQQADSGTSALFAGDEAQELNAGSAILTNATDTAVLQIFTPDEAQAVARIQVYGNTNVELAAGSGPRFGVSSAANRLELNLNSGRLLMTVPSSGERPLFLRLTFPQGEVTIQQPGQYSITTVNEESQFSVLEGQASVVGSEGSLVLATDERAIIPAEAPLSGPLGTERNLVQNSDFSQSFDNWALRPGDVERDDQSDVEVKIATRSNEPIVKFSRVGEGHADASIRQVIDQDITDYRNLQVQVWMQIVDQSLPVCGGQGSECPLIIRIEYTDVNGVDQVWQQGFYAVGTIGADPDICITCQAPLNNHFRVPFDQLVFYETDNLLERLGQLNILPRHINAIWLIASGHTFDVEVLEVAVVASE